MEKESLDKEKEGSFRAFLKTDRAILTACISIAFVFWFMTKMSYSYKSSFFIRLDYTLPDEKVFTTLPPKQLEVDIEGTGWQLLSIFVSRREPVLEIMATNKEISKVSAAVLRNKVMDFVDNSKILHIIPEYIPIQTEKAATKTVPIELDYQITLAPLFQFKDSIVISPKEVQITGPASVVKAIDKWKTTPLILQNVKKSIETSLMLKTHPNLNIRFDTSKVLCTAKVEETTEKQLEVPVFIENAPDDLLLVLLPKVVTVYCRVGLSDYEKLKGSDFKVVIDFKKIDLNKEEKITVVLKEYPNYVSKISVKPQKVDFIVRKEGW